MVFFFGGARFFEFGFLREDNAGALRSIAVEGTLGRLTRQPRTEDASAAASSRALWLAPLLGALLVLSAVGSRTVLDDFVLALRARERPALAGLPKPRWDLFAFTTGEPADTRKLIERGIMLPWWADPRLKVGFFRPLSSLSHRLDYALWPQSPRLMYLHSIGWLVLTLHLAARCYRRWEASPWLGAWGAALYAIDDSHGPVVAWLSNRNALIATSFGLIALLSHDSFRRSKRYGWAVVAATSLLLALFAGEFAVATLGYLAAYAVFLDRAPPFARARALLPYLAVVSCWSIFYVASGAGVQGSGTYLSPFRDPAAFARAVPHRLCALLGAALGPLPADLEMFGPPEQSLVRAAVAVAFVVAASYAIGAEFERDRVARFWLCGMLLATLPVAAAPPSDRLLPLVGVGSAALIARVVAPLVDRAQRLAASRGRFFVALAFGAVHLVLAPVLLPLRAAQMQLLGGVQARASAVLDRIPDLAHRTVVIVSAPLDILASYIQLERLFDGKTAARRLYWLTSAGSSVRVQRSGVSTLLIERQRGFFSAPLELHYRRDPTLAPGTTFELSDMSAAVTSVMPDARPRQVSFRFAEPLESTSYVFLIWNHDRYELLDPKRLDQPLELPAEDLGQILARSALGGAT